MTTPKWKKVEESPFGRLICITYDNEPDPKVTDQVERYERDVITFENEMISLKQGYRELRMVLNVATKYANDHKLTLTTDIVATEEATRFKPFRNQTFLNKSGEKIPFEVTEVFRQVLLKEEERTKKTSIDLDDITDFLKLEIKDFRSLMRLHYWSKHNKVKFALRPRLMVDEINHQAKFVLICAQICFYSKEIDLEWQKVWEKSRKEWQKGFLDFVKSVGLDGDPSINED